MKPVKVTKINCAFCNAKVITLRESVALRQGQKIKKLQVGGGVLVITSNSARTPVCSDCWFRAVELLKEVSPLRELLVT